MKKSKTMEAQLQNRTGVLVAPDLAEELVEGVNRFSPESDQDQTEAAAMRAIYVREDVPIGSRPPADDPGMAALLDKLGARLAFERSGVRLYDAIIQKREALGGRAKPTIADLKHIRDEELEHMQLLEKCITALGGDPTMLTPSADVGATMTVGVLQVAVDPRTTIPQCLEALLAAELIDNDCWSVLIRMMQEQGIDEDVEGFEEALNQEQEHLTNVRNWILSASKSAKA